LASIARSDTHCAASHPSSFPQDLKGLAMLRSLVMLVLLASLAALSGCAGLDGPPGAGAREQTGTLAIRGALSYRARIALPPDSRAIVALKDVSHPDGPVVAEQRIDLHGRQVPIAFDLAVDRAKLDDAKRYAVRGAVFVGGRPVWASDPVMIDRVGRATVDAIRFIAAPANKNVVVQSIMKNLRISDRSRAEGVYADLAEELPGSICPTVPGVRSIMKLMVEMGINPKAAQVKVEDVVDLTLCKRWGGEAS